MAQKPCWTETILAMTFEARRYDCLSDISASASCSFPVKGDAAIRACCCEPFVPSRLWKPFDTPQRLLSLGVRSHACSLLN